MTPVGILDEVAFPAAWPRVPLCSVAPRVKFDRMSHLQPLSVFLDAGVVPRADRDDNRNQLGEDLSKYLHVRPGDIVFNKLRTWQGGLGVSAHEGIVSPAYFVCRPNVDTEPRFLHFMLRSAPYLAELARRSKFMPPSQFDIPWDQLRNLPVLLPPLEEQRRIANYLDAETTRIDALALSRREQLGLLCERRRTLLDEVFSKIEAHRVPLGRFVTSIAQGSSPSAGSRPARSHEWGVLKVSCVKSGIFKPDENKVLESEPTVGLFPEVDDLLVTRANTPDLVGDVCAVPGDYPRLMLPDLIYKIRLSRRLQVGFAVFALHTTASRAAIEGVARGSSQSMVKLRGEDIRSIMIKVPGIERQRNVSRALDREWSISADLSAMVNRQIALLAERRQALITAAVTGQFDVSSAA